MKPFYSDTLARVYQSDVFEWCAWYQREIEAKTAPQGDERQTSLFGALGLE